jgi:trimeric autotransporter adhesin
VPGGQGSQATGDYSFAAGTLARANHPGAFVWADATVALFLSERDNQFRVRANGGSRFDVNGGGWIDIRDDGANLITTSTGATLTLGGAWADASDRALKEHVRAVDGREILHRLRGVPIQEWSYRAEGPAIRHVGPMGQDFHAAFGLGADDRHITTLDAAGIALAAIQALHELSRILEAKTRALEAKVRELDVLRQRLEALAPATAARL